MAEQEKDKNLDQIFDSLLASYSDVEPRPGLETRVVAKLRDHAGRNNGWNWTWTWIWPGAVATAVGALIFIVGLERTVEPPKPPVAPADWSMLPGRRYRRCSSQLRRAGHRHHRHFRRRHRRHRPRR